MKSILNWLIALFVCATVQTRAAQTFRVASYNLENYLDVEAGTRIAKSAEAKAKIRENILTLKPDVLALVEMGSEAALLELQSSLKKAGLDLPHWDHVKGFDTNIHVAVLSRFPFVTRKHHTNDNYLLFSKRFQVSRGFPELDIKVSEQYTFTLIALHLKSKRQIAEADEADMREQEALIVREKIEARLNANPNLNLVVLGDLNDTKDSRAVRAIMGRYNSNSSLIDTRPAERNGDNIPSPNPRWDPRNIAWTHFYGKEDTYSRIDYILLSKSMAKEWVKEETYVLAAANWGLASDHRPIVATFEAKDK